MTTKKVPYSHKVRQENRKGRNMLNYLYFLFDPGVDLAYFARKATLITGMKPQSPENSGETYSATELRGTIPSDFVEIVRLTNFSLPVRQTGSLTPEI